MKKEYQRPALCFESFSLCTSIAAGCEGIANYAENICSVTVSGNGYELELFNYGTGACINTPPNPDDYVCYHAPSDNQNVFSS